MTVFFVHLLACTTDKPDTLTVVYGDRESEETTVADTSTPEQSQDSGENSAQPAPLDNSLCDGRSLGTKVNDCALNFELPDKTGQLVQLHQFAGDIIFLDLSSFT